MTRRAAVNRPARKADSDAWRVDRGPSLVACRWTPIGLGAPVRRWTYPEQWRI